MRLLLLALLLAGCVPGSTRTSPAPGPVDAMATVLRDVRARLGGSGEPLRIMVGENMVREADGPPSGRHPLETLTRLRDLGLVQEICQAPYCPRSPEPVWLRLGRVTALPPGTRVRILGEHWGIPLHEALEAIPDSLAVPADVRVDVSVDSVTWRYYLRLAPDGEYLVLTRYRWGMV